MNNQFYIDEEEAKQILICVIAISLAFTILYAKPAAFLSYPKEFIFLAALCIVTVGSGFILHEMAHKIVAIYYGAHARFQMWTQGLVLMFITSFFGFLFAAPGAVYIYAQKISKKENGIISLVGPFVNVLIAVIFIVLQFTKPVSFFFPFLRGSLNVWAFGAQINVMLALFNMLPAFPLDGSKVFAWSKIAWGAAIIVLLAFASWMFDPVSVIITWGILLVITLLLSRALF